MSCRNKESDVPDKCGDSKEKSFCRKKESNDPDKCGDSKEKSEKPKLRPCCACPETKKARDACVIERGEENCKDLIEKHKQCMRDLGFNI